MGKVRVDISVAGPVSADAIRDVFDRIGKEVELRSWLVSMEVRNATMYVLRGQRSGRTYRVPGTKRTYTASAPGEAPANRTGVFRASWQMHSETVDVDGSDITVAGVESRYKVPRGHLLGEILEKGTQKMSPRPYKEAVRQRAMQGAVKIYNRTYGGRI